MAELYTTSVAWALPYLAHACQTGYLWIDQITIDQSNLEERNHQVRIMRKLYRQSFRCLIWIDTGQSLGIESEMELTWDHNTREEIFNFIQSFSVEEIRHLLQTFERAEERKLRLSFTEPFSKEKWKTRDHLLWFLEHSWFSRTWVY
jgi:hypothetical protein